MHSPSLFSTMAIVASMAELLSSSTLVLISISLVSITITLHYLFKTTNRSTLPPTPFALPIIGHLHLLGPLPHRSLHHLALRLGPLFRLRLGQFNCLVASSASTVKQILKSHESSLSDRPINSAIEYLFYEGSDFTFSPYGPYWHFIRKLCMSQLLGGQTLDFQYQIRHEEVHTLVRTLFEESKNGKEVNLDGEFVKLANNIITRMSIGKQWAEGDQEAAEVKAVVTEVPELSGAFNMKDYIWILNKLGLDLQGIGKRVKTVRERFDRMMERVLSEKKARRREREKGNGGEITTKENKDILDMLLDIHEDEEAEIKLTMNNIKAFIMDMFVAGTDTTSLTMGWALAELINHPPVLQKAAQEIDAIVGKERFVDEKDIPQLPYLQAIIKETLRLHPTGPIIARVCTKDCTIDNYVMPAGTTLFVNVWAVGRDPDCWENSSEFCPERFLGQPEIDVRGQSYQFLPFGTGRRICPGITLAMLVVQTTIATMIQCFDWKVKDGGLADMAEGAGMTLSRAKPLVCVPVPRLDLLHSFDSEI